MKAHIVSLGCPKNLTDSEVIMGQLASKGHEITLDPSDADMIIINTCAFLGSARKESIAVINEMDSWRGKGKCQKIYIAGCLPKFLETSKEKIKLPKHDGFIDSISLYSCKTPRIKATRGWTAYVKISEGCDNRCSYCLIPSIRGSLKLRKAADILGEVRGLAVKGVKEIIFVAQDTTAHPEFADILGRTAKIKGVEWIRIMYAHPKHLGDDVIDMMAKEQKIVKYIDLPLQHSSDRILKAMGRGYTETEAEQLLKKLRTKVKSLAIRTTFITGFPGESQSEFNGLADFIRRMKFEKLGVFPYSEEKGTLAADIAGKVSETVKLKRAKTLMKIQSGISKNINDSLVGKKLEVVIESEDAKFYIGRGYFDAPEIDGSVFIRKNRELDMGRILKVKVVSAGTYDLICE